MITVKLMGGMGNQMFQYAMGLAQARRLGTGLQLDVSLYRTESFRKYSLCLWKGVTQPVVEGIQPTIRESGLPYNPALVGIIQDGDCLYGYWQTEKYFSGIRQELLGIFLPGQPLTRRTYDLAEAIAREGRKSAFLTVRRTDYVDSWFHGVPLGEYYLTACGLVAEYVPDPHFFVFSDEPEWCEKNFQIPFRFSIAGGNDITVGDHLGREDEDLWVMSTCRHAIMANSSYSWWGAWLSQVPDGDRVVTAPKKWFLVPEPDPLDIVPERWIRL